MTPAPSPLLTAPYRRLIQDSAKQWGLDPILLEAQILVESSGNPFAFRYEPAFYQQYLKGKPEWIPWGPLAACSYGLLQIMGAVAAELGFAGHPGELFHPNTNLFWAGKKLAALKQAVGGDLDAMLASYNGGLVGNRPADRAGGQPLRNLAYVERVKDQQGLVQSLGVPHADA